MNTLPAVREPQASPADAMQLGQVLAASGYFADAKDGAKAAVKVMAGAELGLGPVASMRGIDIIKGEVSLSAGLTAALVRRSERYDYEVRQWDDQGCIIIFTRDGEPLIPASEFGPEDAKRAGLGGDNYRKYPRNMYFARAMTNGARLHCPDLFAGSVYVPEELGEFETAQADPVATTARDLPTSTPDAASLASYGVDADTGEVMPMPEQPASGSAQHVPAAPAAEPATETRGPTDPITPAEAKKLRELAQTMGVTPGWLRMALVSQQVDDVSDPVAALDTLTVGQATAVMEAMKRRG